LCYPEAMAAIRALDGRLVDIRYSLRSKVPYVASWEDNVLLPPLGCAWPSNVLKHVNGYVARTSWFADEDAAILAAGIGRISKFQSPTEDAVTWSWFGTLGFAKPEDRGATVQWLYDRVGLTVKASSEVLIDP
jgi:hypothetical protein